MKKLLLTFSLSLLTLGMMAVPARRGIWKTLPLNGIPVKAQLAGDEHLHYWLTEDGRQLTEGNGQFLPADMETLRANAIGRKTRAAARRATRTPRKAIGDFMHYSGSKKGLIILVEFTNMKFKPENDSLRYTRICNEKGYDEGSFRGSVYDYFKEQSYGEFDLTFDVIGPVQMDSTYQYYGRDTNPTEGGSDAHPGQMTAMACLAVADQVEFKDYDWDGDGYVDQVMCIYAGEGQATGGGKETIWPHEWELAESDYGDVLEIDSVKINTYACANERSGNSIMGIGTICHEFSHCLGLPDMYDVNYGGNYGMGEWSLMDQGSYNGNGFCPSGYTSFERYTCGWVKPQVLTRSERIDSMKPLEDAPDVYMIYNDNYDKEYYMLENRQKKGWDKELPGNGMLILHVDYDREIWENNLVNTNNKGGGLPANDHERCSIFLAGGKGSFWHNASKDPYPYEDNDSLTNTSNPSATVYHLNTDGSKLMNKGILEIRRNQGGTMAFRFRNSAEEIYVPEGTIFYESFNNCLGTGGNDGQWSANIASSNFVADNDGWTTVKPYGGWRCARFGNGSTAGRATTPPFVINKDFAYLTFRAAGWNKDATTLTLTVEGDGTVEPSELTMENFVWNEYKVKLTGNDSLRLTFSPSKRFLLDDVLIVGMKGDSTNAVASSSLSALQASLAKRSLPSGYYAPDGRYMGTRLDALPRGIYILFNQEDRRGRKIIK
jgi:M6 family metalloprotease-like protein